MLKELTYERFMERAATGARVAVYREFMADRETPVSVLTRAADDSAVFLLESVVGGERRGRYSFLGVDPYATLVQRGGEVALTTPDGRREVRAEHDAAAALRAILRERPYAAAPELPPLQGGAIGYFAYDAAGAFEPRLAGLESERGTPQAAFLLTDDLVVFDDVRQSELVVTVVDPARHPSPDAAYAAARARIADVYERLLSAASIARYEATHPPRASRPRVSGFRSETSAGEFAEIVAKCKDAIRAGEVMQIVPSQKFVAETDVDALSLYRALRLVNPSPYDFFLRIGGKTLIGSSPEELVRLSGRTASTAPIAGTRPRGRTDEEDLRLERELLSDPKERAEHVMLVDLGRNDLGRVCRPGTVEVRDFAHVERYSHVMHLVSNVAGELEDGADAFDLVRAAFPAGTLTGAPKIRAMELLVGLEKSPRGVYGGAVGYFSLTGDMDFAIAIRTMALEKGTLTMRSGAGIVADSDPMREYAETVNKAKAIFSAARFAATL